MKPLLAVGLFLLATAPAWADWLCFRGPNHQGIAGPGDYPIRWGPKENVAWKVKLPGYGASSPVIQGERVYLTCFTGKKGPEIVRYLMCFERKDGKLLWEQKKPAPQPENDSTGMNLQHGFSTATPIVEGDRIYVNFCRGGVLAFDANGKELWKNELGVYRNGFGSASSPTIYRDYLIVNATTEASGLFALKQATGEIAWKAKVSDDCWSTPIIVDIGNGTKELLFNGHRGLMGYDPETGKERWKCETVGGYVSTTPVVDKDAIYLIGSSFNAKRTIAVRFGGSGDITKSHVLWSNEKVGASYCSPVLVGERLFFFSGQATCVDRKTGKVIAQTRLDDIKQLYSSPIVAGGRIYLFTRNQGAYVISADDKMTVLTHNDLGDTTTINSSPAASDGDIFVRTQEYLYCLRKGK
jgi:outer membrane protein assembly factor BamB